MIRELNLSCYTVSKMLCTQRAFVLVRYIHVQMIRLIRRLMKFRQMDMLKGFSAWEMWLQMEIHRRIGYIIYGLCFISFLFSISINIFSISILLSVLLPITFPSTTLKLILVITSIHIPSYIPIIKSFQVHQHQLHQKCLPTPPSSSPPSSP